MMSAPWFEGSAQIRSRDRVVDDEGHAVPMCQCRHLLDVGHVALRVAEGFYEDGLRPVVDQTLECLGFTIIGEAGLYAVLRQSVCEEVVSATVQRARGDEVIARLRDGENRIAGRCLARGKRERSNSTLECGEALLEHILSRIHDAGVDIAGHLEVEQVRTVLRAVERVCNGLVERYRHGLGGRIRRIPAMDRDGVEAPMIAWAGLRHVICLLLTVTNDTTSRDSRSPIKNCHELIRAPRKTCVGRPTAAE